MFHIYTRSLSTRCTRNKRLRKYGVCVFFSGSLKASFDVECEHGLHRRVEAVHGDLRRAITRKNCGTLLEAKSTSIGVSANSNVECPFEKSSPNDLVFGVGMDTFSEATRRYWWELLGIVTHRGLV